MTDSTPDPVAKGISAALDMVAARVQPSNGDVKTLMCGCPYGEYRRGGHRLGCWMDTVEQLAFDVFTDPAHPDPLAALLTTLRDAGYLQEPDCESELLTLLDALAEGELLAPKGEVHDG